MLHFQLSLMACALVTSNPLGSKGLKKLFSHLLKKSRNARTSLINYRRRSRLAKTRESLLLNKSVSLLTKSRLFLLKKMSRSLHLKLSQSLLLNIFQMRITRMRKPAFLLRMVQRINILRSSLQLFKSIKML